MGNRGGKTKETIAGTYKDVKKHGGCLKCDTDSFTLEPVDILDYTKMRCANCGAVYQISRFPLYIEIGIGVVVAFLIAFTFAWLILSF